VAAFDYKWIHAQLNLAWRVVVHYSKKLWPWSKRYGLLRFQQNYLVEGLPPDTHHSRLLRVQVGRCTGCHRCDDVCPIVRGESSVPAASFIGPHGLVAAASRTATHITELPSQLSIINGDVCAACRRCDAACPEGIPIAAVGAELLRGLRVVENAAQGMYPLDEQAVARTAVSSGKSSHAAGGSLPPRSR
jgi:Fe-S-cluster-containing hydrogenase component 2